MRVRYWAVAALAVGALAACSSSPDASSSPPSSSPTDALGGAPGPATTTPVVTTTTTKPTPPAVAAPLTCTELKNAKVGSPTKKYNGYADYLPLADGSWSGEDGNTVELKVCGVGDVTGDGSVDGLAAISLHTNGSTGTFWTLVVWKNVAAKPVFYALLDLGDRNPVQSIDISGQRATVVYLTRADSEPMAQLSIERTTIFKVTGANLVEVSHLDVPYTP